MPEAELVVVNRYDDDTATWHIAVLHAHGERTVISVMGHRASEYRESLMAWLRERAPSG